MGTRTLWLCLVWGIACSPKPASDSDSSTNDIRSHERSTEHDQTVFDAGSLLLDAGVTDSGGSTASDLFVAEAGNVAFDGATPLTADADSPWLPQGDGSVDSAPLADAATRDAAISSPSVDAEVSADADVDAQVDAAPDAALCNIPEITGSECELATNCGCDAENVCRIADRQTGQTLCFPPGDTASYSPCELDQDCGMGQVCEAGLCRPSCDNPGHYCEDGSSCATFSELGRSVCAGHCNVLTRSPDVWSTADRWIGVMSQQLERGLREEYWTAEYSNCGEGAYCHPGVGPDETSSPSPLYPHCVPANGNQVDNSPCTVHEDCVSGLACGIYPGDTQARCIRVGFVEGDCRETGHGVQRGTNIDGNTLIAPDGINTLGLCTKSVN